MNCSCKASTCRGVIRGAQFLPRELFEKYKDFIPTYLKKVYLKEKVYTPKLQARKGVFAKHALKKGEIIFHVEGPIVRYKFPPNYRKGYQWLALGLNSWIIPLHTNPWWSIHHSCDPNVGVIGKGDVITMRDIKPDEELTVDDSMTEADPRWKYKCTCGKKNCRKIIRSVQFLSPELFEAYKPFMSAFLKQQYLLSHKTRSP